MKDMRKAIVITLVFGLAAFALGPMLFEPSGEIVPTAEQLPFFIVLAVIESLVFGLGVSFIALGWPYVSKMSKGDSGMAMQSFVAIAWSLVSWWPHDGLHMAIGNDATKLLMLEYGFHVTLMISALVLGYNFLRMMKKK